MSGHDSFNVGGKCNVIAITFPWIFHSLSDISKFSLFSMTTEWHSEWRNEWMVASTLANNSRIINDMNQLHFSMFSMSCLANHTSSFPWAIYLLRTMSFSSRQLLDIVCPNVIFVRVNICSFLSQTIHSKKNNPVDIGQQIILDWKLAIFDRTSCHFENYKFIGKKQGNEG